MSDTSPTRDLPAFLAQAENLPSMPAVAVEVLELTQNEDSTLDDLARVLSMDPALSGKLLKIANSSLFNLGSEITTLQRATMVLGMKTVKLMSLSFSLVDALPSQSSGPFDFRQYWRRSISCAVAGRTLAAELDPMLADEAFLSGLLSRIGQLVLATGSPEGYGAVIEAAEGRWPSAEIERRLLGYDAAQVGSALLHSWSLPAMISDCVAWMHDPSGCPDDAPSKTRKLAKIMHLAVVCDELINGPDKRGAMERLLSAAEAEFDLEEGAVEEILRQLESKIAETAEMMQVEMRAVGIDEILRQARELLLRESLGVATEMQQAQQRAAQLESRNRALNDQANTDALTGLPNRRCFDECLADFLEERRSGGVASGLGLLLIDVDFFKAFNDQHGHQVGDRVLRGVGKALRAVVRGTDLPARYGGEEFAVLLPGVSPEGLRAAAERVRAAIERLRLAENGAELSVTASVGGARVRKVDDAATDRALIAAADACLYRAKDNGRNRCEFASGE